MGGVRCLGLFPKKSRFFFYPFPYDEVCVCLCVTKNHHFQFPSRLLGLAGFGRLWPSDDDDGDDDEYFDEFDYCGDNNLVENKHHYGSGVERAKEGRK